MASPARLTAPASHRRSAARRLRGPPARSRCRATTFGGQRLDHGVCGRRRVGPCPREARDGRGDRGGIATGSAASGHWARQLLNRPRARPGYKCHPHADRGTTRRMIEVLRFVVGLAADVVRRRAWRSLSPSSVAAWRRVSRRSAMRIINCSRSSSFMLKVRCPPIPALCRKSGHLYFGGTGHLHFGPTVGGLIGRVT